MKKGISLIVLVITIIVMIVIASGIVLTLNNTNIIDKANLAIQINQIKHLILEFEMYKGDYIIDNGKTSINNLNVASENIFEALPSLKEDAAHATKYKIVNGNLVFIPDLSLEEDVNYAKLACEQGIVIEGVAGCMDIKQMITPVSSYKRVGNIYYNTPDVTGLALDKTFYVTYDSNGNEIIGDNLLTKPPENWYDYENKEWANVVVKDNNKTNYLVWIPRYAYKVEKNNKFIDVRFVNNSNEYIDSNNNITVYNDKEPVFDEAEEQTNYVVSTAFTVNLSEEGKENAELTGFWAGKYEVSAVGFYSASATSTTHSIKVTSANGDNIVSYDFYLNGKLTHQNVTTLPLYEDLNKDTTYEIKIVGRDANGIEQDSTTLTVTTKGDNTQGITGFNADCFADSIEIYSTTLNSVANSCQTKNYEYYLDDVLVDTNKTGAYKYEDLNPNTTYKVTIKIKDDKYYYGEFTRTFVTPNVPTYNEPNAPVLTGLNLNMTYYITYDENGSEIRTLAAENEVPENWYDYENKEWANIVVVDEALGTENYLVWIPRYQYRVVGQENTKAAEKRIDIAFIPVSQVIACEGYLIPASFMVDMTEEGKDIVQLPGFWAGKYEVSELE